MRGSGEAWNDRPGGGERDRFFPLAGRTVRPGGLISAGSIQSEKLEKVFRDMNMAQRPQGASSWAKVAEVPLGARFWLCDFGQMPNLIYAYFFTRETWKIRTGPTTVSRETFTCEHPGSLDILVSLILCLLCPMGLMHESPFCNKIVILGVVIGSCQASD